jgi:DNA polymerase III subunit gamma/tau
MAYLAIARKWRPSRFEDLIGQEHVVQTLRNAIRLDRISHAYLFSGARGIGKTTVARIFAKALRCPNQIDGVPCNACTECQAIADSRSVDVSEIDGASHNGVEAVRSIRDNVSYSPSSGKYKVYIIDEVHMLSISAFNALLKTLEEPPAHVVFIFATTEVQKIPLTILSRCQRFEFRRLKQLQIVERLKHIVDAEQVQISEDGLRTIASYADGSLRDALSLLDQILSHQGDAAGLLNEDLITEALGVASANTITQWLSAVIRHQTQDALQIIDQTYRAGVDLKHFSERALEELRLLYLILVAQSSSQPVNAETLDISPSQYQQLAELASTSNRVEIERMAQIVSKAISQMSTSSLPRFVLEMASTRMCLLKDLGKLDALLLQQPLPVEAAPTARPVVKPSLAPVNSVATPSAAPVRATPPKPATAATATIPVGAPARPTPPTAPMAPTARASVSAMPPSPPHTAAGSTPQTPTRKDITASAQSWSNFVDFAMKKRPLVGALLGHAEMQMGADKKAILKFAQGSFFERQASDAPTRQALEDMLRSYFGPDTTLQLASAGADQIQSMERSRQEETEAIKKSALEHPTVIQMKEALGAEVIDVNVDL